MKKSVIEKIIIELKEMVLVDQEMRNKFLKARNEGKADLFYLDPSIDKKHTERMKEIIEEIGWPTISLVGEESSQNAWLLVQHADHDLAFQKECLTLMLQEKDNVKLRNIAYLSDRIAVAENRPQLYGTQFANDGKGRVKMGNVIDQDGLNKRRADMGLETFEEYLAGF